jgi:hypothetical protein
MPVQTKSELKVKINPQNTTEDTEGKYKSSSNFGARLDWVINATLRLLYPRKRFPVPRVQEAGWDPGTV